MDVLEQHTHADRDLHTNARVHQHTWMDSHRGARGCATTTITEVYTDVLVQQDTCTLVLQFLWMRLYDAEHGCALTSAHGDVQV